MNKNLSIYENLKDFKVSDWIILIISYIIMITTFLISPIFNWDRNCLSLITSLIGVLSLIFISKGKVIAHIFFLLFSILYIFVSIQSKYYGEAIIYCFLMIPIHIFSFVSWNKNLSKNSSVIIEKNNFKEFIIVFIIAVILTIGFYFILKFLNTTNLIVGTISFTVSFIASLLMLRRNIYYSLFFILNDIVSMILWGYYIGIKVYSYIPILINVAIAFINDTYVFVNWIKRYRAQKRI